MSFVVGIVLGIVIAILVLIFILCLIILGSLQFASTHIDALAGKINAAIAKGEEAAKSSNAGKGDAGGDAGGESSLKSNLKNSNLYKNLLFDEIKGKYILN